jgi:hypothetical protein
MPESRAANFVTLERLVGSSITLVRGSLAVSRPLRLALAHLDDAALADAAGAADALALDIVRQAAEVPADPVFWWALTCARGTQYRYAPRGRGVRTLWRPK